MSRASKILLIIMSALFLSRSEAEARHRGSRGWWGYNSGFRGLNRGIIYRRPVYRNYGYRGFNAGSGGHYVPYNYSYGSSSYSGGYYPYNGVYGSWHSGY